MDRLRDGLLARIRNNPKAEMPFLDHLEELRWRILKSLGALVVGTGIAVFLVLYYNVAELLIRPAHLVLGEDFKLINLSPPDTFFVLLQMSLILGFVFASPIVFYHVWVFLAPALEKHERRSIVPALWMGLVLFAGGVMVGYYALPYAIRFFSGILADQIEPSYTASYYLGFVVKLLLGFGVVFELPVVVLVLSVLGLVSPSFLRTKRRYAIVVLLLIACLFSPGDFSVVTILLLGSMIILYEFSILLSGVVWRGRHRRERELKEAAAAPEDSVAAEEPGAMKPEPTPYDHGDPAGGTAPAEPEDEE